MHTKLLQKYLILLHTLTTLPLSSMSAGDSHAFTNATATADNRRQNITAAITINNGSDFELRVEEQLHKEQEASVTGDRAPTERLLSRQRRYLIFPEGSSFQLVWDGIYGIVDFTNYLILGITVALAWELPSKPQSEVLEEIVDRLKDGSIEEVKRKDNATNIVYVDTKKKPASTKRPNYINLSPVNTKAPNNYYYNNRLLPAFRPPMHHKYFYYNNNNKRPTDFYYRRPSAKYGYYKEQPSDWRRKDGHYYTPNMHPFAKWTQRPSLYGYTSKFTPSPAGGNVKYPWWNLPSRLSEALRRKAIPARRIDAAKSQQQQHAASGYYRQQLKPPTVTTTTTKAKGTPTASKATAATRKHRIYPVFGKRSIPDAIPPQRHTHANTHATNNSITNSTNDNMQKPPHHRQRRSGINRPDSELNRMERIHVRHHRTTRQTLYEKIEKYLDKLGIEHSHQCVLRTLCETGQKSGERTPGSFVGELMRAVFTLPEALDEDVRTQRIHYKDQRYDAANAFSGDCATRYGLCKTSLWQTHFVA